jgi:death on curing protein
MTECLDLDDLLAIARAAIGEDVVVRGYGLLESARRGRGRRVRPGLLFGSAPQGHCAAPFPGLQACSDRRKQTTRVDGVQDLLGHQRVPDQRPENLRFYCVIGVSTGAITELDDIAEQLLMWSHQEP